MKKVLPPIDLRSCHLDIGNIYNIIMKLEDRLKIMEEKIDAISSKIRELETLSLDVRVTPVPSLTPNDRCLPDFNYLPAELFPDMKEMTLK